MPLQRTLCSRLPTKTPPMFVHCKASTSSHWCPKPLARTSLATPPLLYPTARRHRPSPRGQSLCGNRYSSALTRRRRSGKQQSSLGNDSADITIITLFDGLVGRQGLHLHGHHLTARHPFNFVPFPGSIGSCCLEVNFWNVRGGSFLLLFSFVDRL